MTCPHCGHEADPDRTSCPLCGTPLQWEQSGEPADGTEARAAGAGRSSGDGGDDGRSLTPWEDGGGLAALATSWWESLVDPSRFFGRLDWGGGLELPVLYYLVFSVVGAGFQAAWNALLTPALLSALGGSELMAAAGASSPFLQFFLSPFKALFGLALVTVFLHPVCLLLSDRARPMRSTARVVCYAAGPQVLLAVPVIGGLAATLWSAVLTLLGVREAHRTSTTRAAGALAVAFTAFMVLATISLVLLVATGAVGSLPIPT